MSPARTAYLIATVDCVNGAFQIVSIGIRSEPAWNLTLTSSKRFYAQLAPAQEGVTYADARETLEGTAGLWYSHLRHLFEWERIA